MSVYLLVEHNNIEINSLTFNTLNAALQLGSEVIAVVVGYDCKGVASKIATVKGISKVLIAENKVYQHSLAERYTPLILNSIQNASALVVSASTFGKNIMPRIAATLGVAQVSDVIEILNTTTVKRPIYAGNAIETITSTDKILCLTVRSTAFLPIMEQQVAAPIEILSFVSESRCSEFVSEERHPSTRPTLADAKIILSGGRGLQTAEGFIRMTQIADRLNAAVGASRAAVDSGLAPNDWQIGQTGQVVAPILYIALGISGAIQHVAGMKDSKVVVAINKDPDAPIFQIADYGLVADLNELFPEWEKSLTEIGY